MKEKSELHKSMDCLRDHLRNDPDYKATWQANLECAIKDAGQQHPTTANEIAPEAAHRFLDALMR